MSTNDTVFIMASGRAGNKKIKTWHKKKKLRVKDENFDYFCQSLDFVCLSLAKMLVRDGEGATKIIEVKVEGASFPKDARRIARAVASSSLVKTAIAGASPNPGRVMAALGAAHTRMKPDKIDVYFNDLLTVKNGVGVKSIRQKLREVLKQNEIKIIIHLNQGNCRTTFWGCDLTEKYVRINKRYV